MSIPFGLFVQECLCFLAVAGQVPQAVPPQAIGPDEIRVAWMPYVPRGSGSPQATFSVATRLVELTVVVRDRKGRPVSDLKKNDFEVYDSGKRQDISDFSILRSVTTGSDAPQTEGTAPRPRFIGLVFNDLLLESCVARPSVIAFAVYFSALTRAKSAAQSFLKEGVRSEDRVSLFSLIDGQVVPFTRDIPAASAAIASIKLHRRCVDTIRPLDIIEDIVGYVAQMPGERLVLLVARDFRTERLVPDEALHRAIASGVVINALDTRGLEVHTTWPDPLMAYISESSGGKYFQLNNDLTSGFRELTTPPEVSYVMAFVSDAPPNSRYHPLKVVVNRSKGYSIQARPGYYADPPVKPVQSPQEAKFDRLALNTETLDDVAASFTTLSDTTTGGAPAVYVVVHVDLARLPFQKEKDRRTEKLTLLAALLDERGNYVTGKKGAIEFTLKEDSFARLSEQGINATFVLEGPPGRYRLRTVVREESEGKMSAALQPVELR